MSLPIDFPSDVYDNSPTFLVGGNARLNLDLTGPVTEDVAKSRPAKAVSGATGVALIAAATKDAAQQVFQFSPGVPVAYAAPATVTMADADNQKTLVLTGTPTVTVNEGLQAGFGCAIRGAFTLDPASTADVVDVRSPASPAYWCVLIQTGTDTYNLVGWTA